MDQVLARSLSAFGDFVSGRDASRTGLPPGPRLPSLAQTLLYLAWPIEFLDHCHAKYGDLFTLETHLFGVEVLVTHPDDVKRVFTGDPDQLHAGEANVLLEPLVGARSVLLLDGAEHLRQRRLLMPPFHGERMLAYARTMQEITEDVISRWPAEGTFSLHPHMQRITLDIILRTIFGAESDRDLGELREALAGLLDHLSSGVTALFSVPAMQHEAYGLSPWAAFLRKRRRADALVYGQIERRRAELARNAPPRQDILAMLLEARDEDGQPMTDRELRDELMTLLVAGHETTATMLCWTMDAILAHPDVEARLRTELRQHEGGDGTVNPAEVGRLAYLDAVIKEALRLRPVIPAVGRRAKADIELRGRRLPAGTMLVPATYLVHQNATLYPRPTEFRPERFLDKKPDPYAWFPFGGGIRRCLGMAFAMVEMKVVVATVLARVRLRKARKAPSKIRMRVFTFAPDRGVEVQRA
jgi:cytochrome P450